MNGSNYVINIKLTITSLKFSYIAVAFSKVEYREMEEKYSQLLDEEDVSDTSEKSKAGGTATPESVLTPVPEPIKKEILLPPEQPSANATTIAVNANAVTAEKYEEVEPDSEQDDPTGKSGFLSLDIFLKIIKILKVAFFKLRLNMYDKI